MKDAIQRRFFSLATKTIPCSSSHHQTGFLFFYFLTILISCWLDVRIEDLRAPPPTPPRLQTLQTMLNVRWVRRNCAIQRKKQNVRPKNIRTKPRKNTWDSHPAGNLFHFGYFFLNLSSIFCSVLLSVTHHFLGKTVWIPPGSMNQAVEVVTKLLYDAALAKHSRTSLWLLVMLYLTSERKDCPETK